MLTHPLQDLETWLLFFSGADLPVAIEKTEDAAWGNDSRTLYYLSKDEARRTRATELLERNRRPIKQIAAAVGFRNEKSFARAFAGWTGVAPSAWREGVRR